MLFYMLCIDIIINAHEIAPKAKTLNEIIEILKKNNFRLYVSAGLSSKSPFITINTYSNMDMQLNIFGIKNT